MSLDLPFWGIFLFQMELLEDGELAQLVPKISYQSVQSISVQRMRFMEAEVSSLMAECRENTDKFNRQILLKWRNKNPKDNRQVLLLLTINVERGTVIDFFLS